MTEQRARALIGTSAWDKVEWRGHFYPRGLPKSHELGHLTSRVATTEINSTFYGLRQPTNFVSWREATPAGFVFAVKSHKEVTHELRLRSPGRALTDFFASGVLGLGDKLGPFLWQIPPSLSYDSATVEAFLSLLPPTVGHARALLAQHGGAELPPTTLADDHRLRHSFEARHPSFLTAGFTELLRRYGVAAVIVNAPGQPVIRELTTDFAYLRLHCDAKHYPDGYDDASLDEWAARLHGWRSGTEGSAPREIFAYFDNPDHSRTSPPFDAIRLQQRLDALAGLHTDRPETSTLPPLW